MAIRLSSQGTSLEPEERVSSTTAGAVMPLSIAPQTDWTLTQSHRGVLEHYRSQIQDGQWHTVPADGYIHAHLTWHLEQAGDWDEIHQLLQAETPTGQNAWYLACDRAQTPETFRQDICRALKLAQAQFADNPAQSVFLQCRYVLILSSLYSQTQNLPPQLIGALVRKQIWTSDQGLAYAEQIEAPDRQASVLQALTPSLSDSQIPFALAIAYRLEDEYYKALALRSLISSRLQEEQLIEILATAQPIQDEPSRVLVLNALVAHLPHRALSRVVETARQIEEDVDRAELFSHLTLRCPVLFPETLVAIRKISDPFARVECFSLLAPHFPEVLAETLAITNQIHIDHTRALALSGLASIIPAIAPEKVPEFFQSIQTLAAESAQALVLNSLSVQDASQWRSQTLSMARQLQDPSVRAAVLCHFVSDDPVLLIEAKETAYRIQDRTTRARALSNLAIQFPNLLSEALTVTSRLQHRSDRAAVLGQLALHFPEVLADAVAVINSLSDLVQRATALGQIAISYPELWPQMFQTLRTMTDLDSRTAILDELALVLPETDLREAVAITQQLHDGSTDISVLSDLAAYLPKIFEPESQRPNGMMPPPYCEYPSDSEKNLNDLPFSLCERCAETVQMIDPLPDPSLRVQVLCSAIAQFDCPKIGIDHWPQLLEVLAQSRRSDVLKYMSQIKPVIFALGGTEALTGVMKSIQAVTRQWS